MKTYTLDGKTYELVYSIGRIRAYEASSTPIMAVIARGGMFSLQELQSILAVGIRREDKGNWVAIPKGLEIAGELIEENGYYPMVDAVADALMRDCPFLFAGVEGQEG